MNSCKRRSAEKQMRACLSSHKSDDVHVGEHLYRVIEGFATTAGQSDQFSQQPGGTGFCSPRRRRMAADEAEFFRRQEEVGCDYGWPRRSGAKLSRSGEETEGRRGAQAKARPGMAEASAKKGFCFAHRKKVTQQSDA